MEDTFPREATRAAILRWLAGNSDLSPDSVVTMTDDLVVAITSRDEGRGVGRSTRLTLREEVINPDAAAAWGGRSIELDLDLDCSRHRVILGARRIYARPNLQGSVRITRSDNTWAAVPADTVIGDVERAACSSKPTQFAVIPPASGPAADAAEPAQAATAEPPAPAPPVQTAEAARASGAPVPTQVAPPAPELHKAAAPAVVRNPFIDTVAAAPAPSAQPVGPTARSAPPAAPAERTADYAVQIAAANSADLARDSWRTLKAKLPDLIGPRTFAVEPVSTNGRTLYRALLLGFASPREAAALCKTLRSQSVDCILRQMK